MRHAGDDSTLAAQAASLQAKAQPPLGATLAVPAPVFNTCNPDGDEPAIVVVGAHVGTSLSTANSPGLVRGSSGDDHCSKIQTLQTCRGPPARPASSVRDGSAIAAEVWALPIQAVGTLQGVPAPSGSDRFSAICSPRTAFFAKRSR